MHEIFLSYSRRDSSTVEALSRALSDKGLSVWVDRSGLEEGDAYDTQIEEAIAQTRIVVVLWSQNSIKSHWVRAEAAYALGKHKLLPISIDQTEPPLQFHHIQTIDFSEWEGGNEGDAFSRLTSAIAKRLDRQDVAPDAKAARPLPARLKRPQEAAKAAIVSNPVVKLFFAALVAAGLRFPETVVEKEFREYFRERTFVIAQFSILLALTAYVVYGVSDMASDTGGVRSTRFRFMVACPMMLAFYGLSFRIFAKRYSQTFIATFAIALSLCIYITVALLGIETPFRIQTGNGTMNFMLTLGLLGLLPLNVVVTVLVGAVMTGLHALIMMDTHIPLSTSWLNYLHVSSMWTVACCVAYWRERLLRRSFADEMS